MAVRHEDRMSRARNAMYYYLEKEKKKKKEKEMRDEEPIESRW